MLPPDTRTDKYTVYTGSDFDTQGRRQVSRQPLVARSTYAASGAPAAMFPPPPPAAPEVPRLAAAPPAVGSALPRRCLLLSHCLCCQRLRLLHSRLWLLHSRLWLLHSRLRLLHHLLPLLLGLLELRRLP